jgi:hypothetical protein
MTRNRRRAGWALGLAGAAVAAGLVLSGQPVMAATGHDVGSNNELGRCYNSPLVLCLYYHGDGSGAYWGLVAGGSFGYDSNLGDNYFIPGTGAGGGQVVRNNAAYLDCDYSVGLDCASYYSPNLSGNWDYAYRGFGGEMFLTWNNEASVAYA